jgi:hypothetical protein
MSYSTTKSSLLSVLSGPPKKFDERNVLLSTLLLTVLLVAAVPIVAVLTGIPTLALVVVAGMLYAVVLVATDAIFEGMCGAIFVLCTVSANIPILEQPTPVNMLQLNVILVDLVAVPLALLFLYWSDGISIPTDRHLDTVVGYALVGVVMWSALSAIVSNGPSRFGAIVFLTTQLRYLLLFGIAIGIVRYTGLRTALYSLLIAVGGNMAYAIAEVLNRGSFGLSYLGDAAGITMNWFYIGPMIFPASTYAGGFVGFSRALLLLIILFLPVAIERIVNGSTGQRLLVAIYLLASAFIVRISASDAGFGAFLLTVLVAVVVLSYIVSDTDFNSASETLSYLYGYIVTLGGGALGFLLFSEQGISLRTRGSGDGSSGTADGSNGDGSSGSADGSNGEGISGGGVAETPTRADAPSTAEQLAGLLDSLPLVDAANLSIRLQQYAAAIDIGIAYPLFGIGGRNFLFVAKSYGVSRPIVIHNAYLGYLAAIGIPGALLFIGGLLAVFLVAVAETVRTNNDDRLLWGMLACGLLGFYAFSFWTSGWKYAATYMTFWVLAGAVVGARRHKQQTGEASRSNALVT